MHMAFISHSDHDGTGNARSVTRAVKERLTDQGWAVKVDMDDLRPGDLWRDRLYQYLAECRAAVVLLNRAALTSPWVRREVNMLLWRKALGSPVTLVPVLLDGVTSADIRGTDMAQILELQAFRKPRPDGLLVAQDTADDRLSPEDLAEEVAKRLTIAAGEPLRDDSSLMYIWLDGIVSCLGRVREGAALHAAARELTEDDTQPFVTADEGRQFLARRMLGRTPSTSIYNALTNIGRLVGPDLGVLVGLLAPVWVDPEAAGQLLSTGGDRVIAAVNTSSPDIGTRYVQRASCCHLQYQVAQVSLVDPETFVADCEAALRPKVGLEKDQPLDGVGPFGKDVVFLVVDPAGRPARRAVQLVSELAGAHTWLNVLVLTGDEVPDEDWRCGQDRVRFLRPALDRADETDADRYDRMLRTMADRVGPHA
ncbi:toll/interleukin-1 receptor domain-containing protein [Streptomyces sp. NPDC017936]|uniref:toll/interleukin-1 receptor domain-containing protein n=1 Tax=Streptomyces sp. NPDC017936 TaxID=3365016 RepID=UPI0037AB535F